MDPQRASLDDLYADKPASVPSTASPAPAERQPQAEPAPAVADPVEGAVKTEAQSWQEAAKPAAPEDRTKKGADSTAKPADAKGKAKAEPASTTDDDEDEALASDDVAGLKAALKASRRKARERGSKASELEAKLAEESRKAGDLDQIARQMYGRLQQIEQPAQPQQQPPDPVADPEGYINWRENHLVAQLKDRDQKISHEIYMARVVPSQRMMRQMHADYDQVEALFAQTANAAKQAGDPGLWNQIRQQEFPAEYAYQVGKEIMLRQEIAEAGSLDKYLEQKAQAKLAELQAQNPTPTVPVSHAPKAPPPQSLARVPSVTPRTTSKTFNGLTPLADLYK